MLDLKVRFTAGAIGLCLGLGAPLASAAPPAVPDAARAQPLASSAARMVARLDASQSARSAQGAASDASGESRSFFRTRRGVAVIVLMVAGTGYAIYSAKHDRIANPLR